MGTVLTFSNASALHPGKVAYDILSNEALEMLGFFFLIIQAMISLRNH